VSAKTIRTATSDVQVTSVHPAGWPTRCGRLGRQPGQGCRLPERDSSFTGKKAADGSTIVQFGGCDGKVPNCIPIVNGWNYTVRLCRPRAEILSGRWKFPEPRPL